MNVSMVYTLSNIMSSLSNPLHDYIDYTEYLDISYTRSDFLRCCTTSVKFKRNNINR